ncbi:hypothetical protein [Streptomyces zingiberis]|uniref:hypothetical protein n=1 Tax=Streptomyces zingiberis TaxID=2053010 RepID=UPI001F0D034F|nr:hypothetical protein [Streptomyces zingiberis]
MSDAARRSAAEVRAAAEAVKAALDRHLAAVERRSGEDDPAVFTAFNELAAAAEVYDELLYDAYDEVTPFEIPGEDSPPAYTGPENPSFLSVLIRRDYAVAEPRRLFAQAERIIELDPDAEPAVTGARTGIAGVGSSVHTALGVLFGEFEPDEIASRHQEFGLEEGDSTLWVTAVDEPPEAGEWLSAPFEEVDSQQVLCRFDVSSVFDEEDFEDAEDAEDAEEIEDADEAAEGGADVAEDPGSGERSGAAGPGARAAGGPELPGRG